MEKKKKIILGIGIGIFLILLALGSTYAYWMITKEQANDNIVSTGCFQIEFLEEKSISLLNAHPVSDEKGLTNKPYTFKLVNVCDSLASYQINLETMSQAENVKVLPDKYLKAGIQEGTKQPVIIKLNTDIEVESIIDGATTSYKLLTGTLRKNETKTFHLRLWMDSETLAVEESMNASYKGRVSITTSYKEDQFVHSGTLMARGFDMDTVDIGTSAFWSYTYNEAITKIIFEPTMNPHETSEELIFDVSENQDGSVMSYLVPNEENTSTYTLYIQSNGGVKANPDSSGLFGGFSNVTEIQGLDYFDTSSVTDMSWMFSYCSSLTNLDVSHFDTSNVTSMRGMFWDCSSLNSLDVSSFDTSNVTNMGSMFSHCSNLTSLVLSSFDTSKVTSMSEMFLGMTSLASLNLSHFDTSNVTNMSVMFSGCTSLTDLDVSNFDTSKVTSMRRMFANCSSLASLDLSHFDTTNVTNMSEMFSGCYNLTNLNVSSFNTSNVITMSSMLEGCYSLTSLDVSRFDTSNVTNMASMFANCNSLTSLDLSHFDTGRVENMWRIFMGCTNLVEIFYSDKFIYANDANIESMFKGCLANKPTHESWNDVSFE